jgi:glucosyl-dolichyl phosphate glucuronosyltransferase
MMISVLVPTSGRAAALARTLPTVLAQSFPREDYEVLVVENGPESGARRVAEKASRHHPRHDLRYLHEPTPGLLAGRHRGALEARGEILVFADDDIDAAPGWLEAIAATFSDPRVHLVGGRNLPRYEAPPPAWIENYWYTPPHGGRACIYLSLLDLGEETQAIDANYVWGLNFSIRRTTLFELGGFHPDNVPDHLQQFQGDGETGLTMKANERGLRAVYQPEALIHHRVPISRLTVGYFQKRAFYQGVCESFTALRREPAALLPEPPSLEVRGFADLFGETGAHRGAGSRRGALGRLFGRLKRVATSPEPTFDEVDPQVQAAYRAGYEFHRRAASRSPRLLAWVLREDYWDYRFPELELEVPAR